MSGISPAGAKPSTLGDIQPSSNNEKTLQLMNEIEVHPGDEKGHHSHQEVLADKDLLSDAFKAENVDHEMGMWEAAKMHPQACFWAFIMAFTIVSTSPPLLSDSHNV